MTTESIGPYSGAPMELVVVLVALLLAGAFFYFRSQKRKAEESAHPIDEPARDAPAPRPLEPRPASPPPAQTPAVEQEVVLREKEEQAAPEPDVLSIPTTETEADPAALLPSIPPDAVSPPAPVRSETPRSTRRSQVDFKSLRRGLAKTREETGFFGKLKNLLSGKKEIAPSIATEIEELLLTSDVGVKTTARILGGLTARLGRGELSDEEAVWGALREEACRIVDVEGRTGPLEQTATPTVILFVGVNGAGKTTTIGKLARQLKSQGHSVMLAAGDTFRAAAVEQLRAWGERTECEVVAGKEGADPSSVLFDAVERAKQSGVDFLLADTAGRLHTKANLMQEMTKIERTLGKALPGAPHEIFLVIDATNGQNAMAQAREFKEALSVSGLILTKLDGTARGGVVLGICDTLSVPVRYVGVGEKPEDLQEFGAAEFVEALLGKDDGGIAA